MSPNVQSRSTSAFEGKSKPLRELCYSITDCHHSTPVWTKHGKNVIRNFNIKNGKLKLDAPYYTNEECYIERTSRSKPEPGDLIITREAPMGQVCVIPEGVECCLGQRLVLIKPDPEKINSSYLLYALLSEFVQKQIFQSDKTGYIVSNLRIPLLKDIQIPIVRNPNGVAAVLSTLDAKIECNNRINAELEAMAKILYDNWFVQFDFPDEKGKPYKSSGGRMVYNPTLKREMPTGWKAQKLGDIVSTTLGGTPSTTNKEFWEKADIAWLSSAETANFPVTGSEQLITQKGIENSAAVLLPRGSVVVSIVRYIRPSILGIDAATNQSVVGILENIKFKKSFIYPFICGEVPKLMGLRTGAQQPHINKGTVDETMVAVPIDHILEDYYKVAEPIYSEIITKAFENHHLGQLRDWLLPMLMNGQVTVAEGETGP